eukprot:1714198-Rhodomonas_salina.1
MELEVETDKCKELEVETDTFKELLEDVVEGVDPAGTIAATSRAASNVRSVREPEIQHHLGVWALYVSAAVSGCGMAILVETMAV